MSSTTPGQTIPLLSDSDVTRPSDAVVDEQGRTEPPMAADERRTLLGFLDYQRATLHWKCSGLGADELQVRVADSTMTLGGIVKHLAWVEDHWFTQMLRGEPMPQPWQSVDWQADQDWEWNSAAADAPGELFTLWQQSVARSRHAIDQVSDLGTLAARSWPDGQTPSLRWILTHMIEEYARHNGHADLIRESIDGSTGE
ncbi:MAG TPA: DinB family protein [Ruania sp.]|nr:DinB family protein [Ruania sp.]